MPDGSADCPPGPYRSAPKPVPAPQVPAKKRIDRTLWSVLAFVPCWGGWCINLNPQMHLKFRGCRTSCRWQRLHDAAARLESSRIQNVPVLTQNCLTGWDTAAERGDTTHSLPSVARKTPAFREATGGGFVIATPRSQSLLRKTSHCPCIATMEVGK